MASGDEVALCPVKTGEANGTSTSIPTRRGTFASVLRFPDTGAIHYWPIPPMDAYGGGGLTTKMRIGFATATSGTAIFGVRFLRSINSSTDLDTAAFSATQNTATATAPSSSGQYVEITITHTDGTQIDSLTTGSQGWIEVERTGGTASGDAEIIEYARVTES